MLNVYTCTEFAGRYQIGAAAVVVAENKTAAIIALMNKLDEIGLSQELTEDQVIEVDLTTPSVDILHDGDY